MLLIITAVGGGLRIYHVAIPIVFSDEAFSWRVASRDWSELFTSVARDVHPPGHFVLLKLWMHAWGDSPGALRSLSVVAGTASIVLTFFTCRRAGQLDGARGPHTSSAWVLGGLLAAALIALQPLQLDASRVGRMYGIGALLTGLTSFCLLGTMTTRSHRYLWWTAYTISAAAFLYVHYYAIFTIAAQVMFLLAYWVVQVSSAGIRHAPRLPLGVGASMAAVGVLYAPWWPTFLSQTRDVQEGYWIEAITLDQAGSVFVHWLSGIESSHSLDAVAAAIAATCATAWLIRVGSASGLFCLLAALFPVVAAYLVSVVGARSILQERYFTFAQFSMILAWGAVVATLRTTGARLLLCACLVGVSSSAAWAYVVQLPSDAAAPARAVQFLETAGAPDALAIVPSLQAVNIIRYYARQEEWGSLRVRHRGMSFPVAGHVIHLASLEFQDFLWPDWESRIKSNRIWVVNNAIQLPRHWKERRTVHFHGSGRYRETTSLFNVTLSEYVKIPVIEGKQAPGVTE